MPFVVHGDCPPRHTGDPLYNRPVHDNVLHDRKRCESAGFPTGVKDVVAMFVPKAVVIRPNLRHPLPSLVPKPASFLPAVLTDGAILSRSSIHCDRPPDPQGHSVVQTPSPAAIPARLGPRGQARPGHTPHDWCR